MLMTTAATVAMLALQQTDTTLTVRPGARLDLDGFDGTVTVDTWNRNAVRIRASYDDDDDGIQVGGSASVVTVRSWGRHGPATVDYRLTVPTSMELNISAHSGDVSIDGAGAGVTVETVEGGIALKGGNGFISLHSVEGDITLEKARGRMELNSVDGGVRVREAAGELRVESVDGEIDLDDIESSSVDVNTVDGSVTYRGRIAEGGRYRLVSHDGDVTLIAPDLNAAVSVSTYSGDFESDFPVTLTNPRSSKRMSFTLGAGSARIELESFDGSIRIQKPGGKSR